MLRRVLISMTVVASTAFAGASLSSAQPVQYVAMAQPAEETASAPVADLALGERHH